ncbi:uncharacterized protein K460DRAFT_419158 [Cucurbitaria berberidis CBS 394.84]|uniref:Uncharacterized protein n=1 Tax=Cucurbitaria berberidis CBS 394.84 TaxID=1168544 RepID=A0A9P4GE00_9PLEO|nr:uncharacterized protein K460DRAFT_419158 [Cucurbitaria berberidis CBS 394.84]KAF1844213.1 hypothetical protein K460DRAFT_419158 [Cucurbitaria berberidis CBS 394.84]
MSPLTPLRRSPRLPQQEQTTNQMAHYQPSGSRQPSVASQKQSMGTRSRAGSIANTHRSTRASPRQANASGGVVGLPGAGDSSLEDFFEPNFWNANNTFFDEFLKLDVFETTGNNIANMSTNNFDANQSQNINLPQQEFETDFQNGLGFKLLNPKDAQKDQAEQDSVLYNQQAEADPKQLDLVPVNSTSHPAFESTNNNLAFGPWNDVYGMPAQPSHTTPGFSAIPGGSSFPPPLMYPDPLNSTFSPGPYFNPPVQQYHGYIPISPQFQQPQGSVEQPITKVGRARPRRSSYKDPNVTAEPDSDSEDDVLPAKRPRQIQRTTRSSAPQAESSRRYSTVSDTNSLSEPVKVTVVRAGEKPKKCEDKSWVRINTTTKGETTRTARINQFTKEGPKYKIKPLPIGDWQSGKFKFEYNQHNGMDEFKKRTMSARQIHEYISQHPGDLRIWIQVTPGDSARRYASKSHSECLFEQCPNRQWANKGTIEVGNYRVAFDEKHKAYGKGVVDPFDCVAYAHLYCMERFLDFEGICQDADVKVDTRGEMVKEPKGVAAFTFSGKHVSEKALAEKFVKAAKVGQLGRTPEFANYPVHTDYARGEPKPHPQTLIAAMYNVNWEHRTRSQLKQFVYRNIKPGSFGIHRGDQEIIMVDKKVETLRVYKKAKAAKRHKDFDHSAYYDQFHPEINTRIAECLALRAQFKAEDDAGTAPARGGSRKRRVIVPDSDDDEPDFNRTDDEFEEIGDNYEQQQRVGVAQGSRSSPRKKSRINYTEAGDVPQQRSVYDQIAQYVPTYDGPVPPTPTPYVGPTQANSSAISPKSRKASCTGLFIPKDRSRHDIDQQAPIDVSNMPALTNEELDYMLSLPRRKSSTLSIGPYSSIMKSPKLSRATRSSARTASFNAQPVTSSKEYYVNDPPSQVAVSPDAAQSQYNHHEQGRRSARLAGKTSPSLDKVATGRVGKRRRT